MKMQKQILFIQGGGEGAYDEDEHLVAYLRRALGQAYDVHYPKMPRESEPDYQRWKPRIRKELASLGDGMILVGHSVGASVLVKYLLEEKVGKAIAGIFLIAAPYWGADDEWQHEGFALSDDAASSLPDGAKAFFYHSRDDEVVPFAHLKRYAKRLKPATTRALDGRGHQFHNELPEVAGDIRSL